MAGKNYDIATTIKLNGEKEFDKALGDANRSMRVMDSELKKLEAAFDAGGTEMDYFTGKADALGREYKQQEAIVDALRRAVEEQNQAYGEASAEVQKYQIRLNNAEAKLSKLAKASETANRELEDLGRDSNKIGRQIENGIGDAAEDVSEKLDGMFERVSADIAEIRNNSTFEFFSSAVDFGAGIVTGIADFTESTREYRRSLSFLEQNAKTYNQDFSAVKELLFEMASVTGEVDSSVEALSNLMAAGFDGQMLASAVDLLGGAVIRFPDTLKFESLADGLQETLATGEATGQYAELLGRLGVDVEEFNKALDKAKTAEEDQQIALAYLTEHGLASAYQGYKDVNAGLVDAEAATLRWNDALATLGETLEPATTWFVNLGAAQVEDFAKFLNRIPEAIETGDILKLFAPAGEKEVPEESRMDTEGAENFYDEAAKAVMEKYNVDEKMIAALKKAAQEKYEKSQETGSVLDREWWEYLIPSAGAEELPMPFSETDLQTDFEAKGSMAWAAYTSGILSAAAENPAMQAVLDAEMTKIAEENDAAFTAGNNAMISFANGIADGSVVVMNNVNTLVNQINKALASIAMPAYGYGLGGITGGSLYIGRETLTDTVSRGMKVRVDTKNFLK